VLFPQLQGKCQGKTRKDGARPALFHTSLYVCCSVVICVVRLLFVLFCVLFVCKCVLPPGVNPSAVNKYIISCKAVQKLQLAPNMRVFLQGESLPRNLHIYSVLVKDSHKSLHPMAPSNFKAHFIVSCIRKEMAEQRLHVVISRAAVSL
jgi:hypothetical protein